MRERNASSVSYVETVAGFTAGTVSTLCLHPLDLVKTRLQIDSISRSRVGGSIRLIRNVYKTEGGIAAFYRGLSPNIIGNSTSWAAYFLFYGNIKDFLRHEKGVDSEDGLGASGYFLASGAAGVLTSILTNPVWVIKTRMLSTGSSAPGAYPSFIAGARQILASEGLAGFYRGLVPSLFGVSHGAFQFMAYEKLKSHRLKTVRELGNLDFLFISGLSKIFAGCITYPYQVLRTRLQAYHASLVYRGGVWDVMRQIWRQEGITGFYKGLGPNLVRVLPSTWVTFLVYENTKGLLL
ncbi:mitochondrial carrier domain-containing protein [Talaromyces proteolyticus]|uniref:Mitochondrial carrier domain-containing protein n=1 Tax=Talaromyces proteolyticus TaxID=1131652 RepID=A0AAD4PRT3_9EURO|nr:mitochondrial carrier domain-containing protein [Talaromyces proteolyticus]KAH8689699.1 mitochondrial carrier domain-containing protein [Talaromyces proteolyticus]